jgi:hypothetical protein
MAFGHCQELTGLGVQSTNNNNNNNNNNNTAFSYIDNLISNVFRLEQNGDGV